MKTPRTRIAQVIAERTLSGADRKELSKEIAAYLLAEGRVSELNSLLRDVQVAWAAAGYLEVIATVAHPLTSDAKSEIERIVRAQHDDNKKIVITEILNPDVLGGVQVVVANKRLDLSVEAKLNKFKQLTGSK